MNQTAKKTILLTLMAITGGFAALCLMEQDPTWTLWLAGFAFVLSIYLFLFHSSKKKQPKRPEVQSVLDPEAIKALEAGQIPKLEGKLKLRTGEKLFWTDQMRTDFYNSEPYLFYLTDQRLVCLDENFHFSHPLNAMTITRKENKISIKAGKTKMTFLCASPEAFMQALALAEAASSK